MKDLFKKATSITTSEDRKSGDLVSNSKDVASFLSKVAKIPRKGGDARLMFALDATASRQPTWDLATQLQADMFSTASTLGGLNLQLCYFRGLGEFYASGWHTGSEELLGIMTRIQCEAGATQLVKVLRHAVKESKSKPLSGVVFIGDAMEESRDTLAQLSGKLGLLNVPLFIFQEGGERFAREVFMDLCRLSGGAYSQFDAASADQLKELLRAVAVYAAGGLKALKDFSKSSHHSVKLLEQQLKS